MMAQLLAGDADIIVAMMSSTITRETVVSFASRIANFRYIT